MSAATEQPSRIQPRRRIPVVGIQSAILMAAAFIAAHARAADVSSSRPLDCSQPLVVNGMTYDLTPLASLSQPITLTSSLSTPPSLTRTTISISLCSKLPPPSSSIPPEESCPTTSRICQIISSTRGTNPEVITQVIPLSTEEYGYEVSLGDRDGADGERNLEWEFNGPNYAGRKQEIEIKMVCDPTATAQGGKLEWRGYESLDGKAKLRWRSSVACPVKRKDGSPADGDKGGAGGGETGERGGWGFFSWFFFLIVLGFIVYFVLGTYQNHQRYGVAEIPHRDFWREAPYLIQDAGRHAWKSLSGQGGGRGGAYEPV